MCVLWGRQHSAILSHLSWLRTAQHQNTPTKQEERLEQGREGRKQAEASSSKREKAQGRQQRTGGEKAARAKEVGACSSNGVQRGVPDQPRANTSVRKEKHLNNTRNMVEDRAPHGAEALCTQHTNCTTEEARTWEADFNDFPAPEMEPESAHVVSAVSVPQLQFW